MYPLSNYKDNWNRNRHAQPSLIPSSFTRYNSYMNTNYSELFSAFTSSVEAFIREVKNKKSTLMATDEWTVKDELCHITFWHENYAANYEALVKHEVPPLPDGMSTINMAGVLYMRQYSMKELIEKLRKANKSLYESIVVKQIPQMTYSKGGRTYETADFLQMITRHINTHTKQVKNAKESKSASNGKIIYIASFKRAGKVKTGSF